MVHKKGPSDAVGMRTMFGRIAARYNLMNRLMTFGQDRVWRRYLVIQTVLPEGGRLLDVGTGTGDIALETLRQDPTAHIIGADLTLEMIRLGRHRLKGDRVGWCQADALRLPFRDSEFDAVSSGYLIRNVPDAEAAFKEQARVVRPGGRVVCLDTSPVPQNLIRPLILLHLKLVIPLLARLVTGQGSAYRYLPESTLHFMEPERLAKVMRSSGLKDVGYRRFMFGTIAVHWGIRPS